MKSTQGGKRGGGKEKKEEDEKLRSSQTEAKRPKAGRYWKICNGGETWGEKGKKEIKGGTLVY